MEAFIRRRIDETRRRIRQRGKDNIKASLNKHGGSDQEMYLALERKLPYPPPTLEENILLVESSTRSKKTDNRDNRQ